MNFPRVTEAVHGLKTSNGWTVQKTAESLGISESTLRRRLNHESQWRFDELFNLCVLTGLDPDWLVKPES